VPGAPFVEALVPDEDPDIEPTVHTDIHDAHVIPYEVMRWFMEKVAEEVERCRASLAGQEPTADP
jgi:hypothetical protein